MVPGVQDFDGDNDIVYVDFDDLFNEIDVGIDSPSGLDDDGLIAHYLSDNASINESEMVQSYNAKNNSGPKPMTKEQFYKIRPKLPRIKKGDPRRNYGAAYADAYNSCDFDEIWSFLENHCVKDFTFVQQWVGTDQYLNFPANLEIKGIDAVAEYWFSRCLLAPDLALQLKVTKLFVRSDGLSTVASSFSILSTRLFDGELSDSLIRTVATQASQPEHMNNVSATEISDASMTSTDASSDQKLDEICNRVIEKVDQFLLQAAPEHDQLSSLKRKRKRYDSLDFESAEDTKNLSASVKSDVLKRKRMPRDKTIKMQGNVTMHLNEDHKIYRLEVSFALQPEEKL
jgi:hypothetical protein